MGFITNQWLIGVPERDREHSPAPVEVSCNAVVNEWSELNDIVFDIKVERGGGDYQLMYLTQDDVDKLLPEMVEGAGEPIRLKTALAILAKLTDAELVQFMTSLLSERAKTTVSGSAESQAADTQP